MRTLRAQIVRALGALPGPAALSPQYTVVELATGADHGTWDSWEEVAMCLAFARLSLDQVEVLVDQSPMQSLTEG